VTAGPMHVVALGARTPLGLSAESAAAALRAGISRLEELSYFVGPESELLTGAHDPLLSERVSYLDRLATMTLDALAQVLRKLASADGLLPRIHLALALPEARPGFDDADGEQLLYELTRRTAGWGFEHRWEVVGRGHAGACVGFERARAAARDAHTLWLVGGVDSYFTPATLHAFVRERRLATPTARAGFPPGEGAGWVALASERSMRSWSMASLGMLSGVGTAREPARVLQGEVSRAQGLCDAVLGACAALRLPEQAPTLLLSDINGERHRAEEWGLLQLRLGAQLPTSTYETPTSYWGDVGAASLPLYVALACRNFACEPKPAQRALLWAGSDAGLRGAALIEQPLRSSG
jgi:3-oxoacyl-[acyl-carrier-protein] synthase I